jgi:hypothetical protein
VQREEFPGQLPFLRSNNCGGCWIKVLMRRCFFKMRRRHCEPSAVKCSFMVAKENLHCEFLEASELPFLMPGGLLLFLVLNSFVLESLAGKFSKKLVTCTQRKYMVAFENVLIKKT